MQALVNCKLFEGLELSRIVAYIDALGTTLLSRAKGEVIIHQGESTEKLGIVLSGRIEAIHYCQDGTFTIVSELGDSEVFADFLAADYSAHSPVSIVAKESSRIGLLPFNAMFKHTEGFETEQRVILSNLSKIYAEKYFELKDRLICISAPTLRGKLINYFSYMSQKAGSDTFTIHFDRAGLASYLNADRSALSRELSKMKSEGLLECYKNSFKLLKPKNDTKIIAYT